MSTRLRFVTGVIVFAAGLLLVPFGRGTAWAQQEKNACGCYKDAIGLCYCDKKAKCGCPGECEPKGCDDRERALEREIQEETRRAQEEARKQSAPRADDGEDEETAPTTTRERVPAAAPARSPRERAPAVRRMVPAQKRQLARLLEAYLAENPTAHDLTLDELGQALAAAPSP